MKIDKQWRKFMTASYPIAISVLIVILLTIASQTGVREAIYYNHFFKKRNLFTFFCFVTDDFFTFFKSESDEN